MAIEWENGIPILSNKSLLSDVPAYTQAMAAASIMPVGAILPYMGATAPDYWLLCDGSEYDPNDLPELYAVNGDFHAFDPHGGVFRVPDLRGRAPFGVADGVPTTDADIAAPFTLGQRYGDARIGEHVHDIINGAGGAVYSNPGSADATGLNVGSTANGDGEQLIAARWWRSGSGNPLFEPHGMGRNVPPGTGVNFIVYAGRSTAGITPIGAMPAMTTRMMIESRLADSNISEEEREMLEAHLAGEPWPPVNP